MTQEELLAKVTTKFPKAAKAQTQIKDYLTLRLSAPEEVLPCARFLKEDLGFNYLEIVSATDWLGPVSQEGYIKNPNPNVFLPEGATPQIVATATPGFSYRPVFDLLWLFGNIQERMKVFLRLEVARQEAKAPSLVSLFRAADWQEREIFDLLGIRFEGHPNLIKILTPDFIIGHPLRKDYVHLKDKYDE